MIKLIKSFYLNGFPQTSTASLISNKTVGVVCHWHWNKHDNNVECSNTEHTDLWVEVKEAVILEPEQKNLILLHILFHQWSGGVQPPSQTQSEEHKIKG